MKKYLNNLYTKAIVALALLPSTSFATDISSVIDNGVEYLQGGVARSIGVIAIVIAGYLCIFKQMFPKVYFAMILVGLGLIYSATEVYSVLAA